MKEYNHSHDHRLSVSNNIDVLRDKLFTGMQGGQAGGMDTKVGQLCSGSADYDRTISQRFPMDVVPRGENRLINPARVREKSR